MGDAVLKLETSDSVDTINMIVLSILSTYLCLATIQYLWQSPSSLRFQGVQCTVRPESFGELIGVIRLCFPIKCNHPVTRALLSVGEMGKNPCQLVCTDIPDT